MNHAKWISSFIFSGCLLVVLMGSKPATAADCEPWVARAVSVQGNVQVQRVGVSTWKNIKLEDRFCPGDMIRILEKSRAALVLRNESVIRLDENTTITVKAEEKSRTLLLRLINGAVHFFSRVPRSLKVATPFVNCAVEATEFFVRVEASRTYFSVFRGRVRTFNDSGELLLAGGQTAIAAKDQAPSMITIARPRDAVNWSLYYPSIGTPDGTDTQKDLYSASKLLQTGQVTEAQQILTRVLKENPDNSDALALNAIIALTLHRKEDARVLAEKAVASNPTSSPAKLALGYVQQAFFNVDAARGTMQSAAAENPENALVWARLSELWLATGYLDKALSAAEKAAALSPDISRTQTVLGYAYISQIKIKNAKEAFQKAIVFDQADPLPRLGLGLALIREGDLKAGRAQIEIAAALDPGNALVRSYLGKAFYEEKKNDLAGRQYAVAKELDPNDPTPYYYDAIRKQTENRPVEAFHDLQKSIEKNDNRAVYRSRLLLDEDLATRSASLARIYDDLGFQQLALVEGWKSINIDPGNYSAHRFLADSYAALPRHEIARVSEQLQAQLRRPLNNSPIQPQLSESKLFIYENTGPTTPTLNEYTPLFSRDRASLLGGTVLGGDGTWGDEVALSALFGKYAFNIGQFHYQTDGFRENNDQERNIYTGFFQTAISPKTSIQGEIRQSDIEYGDLVLRFDPDAFSTDVRQIVDITSYRLGFHHLFNPAVDIIGYAIYQDWEDRLGLTGFDWDTDRKEFMAEIQQLYKLDGFDIVSGVSHSQTDAEDSIFDQFDLRNTTIYLYSHIHYPDYIMWTVGASGDFLKDELFNIKKEQFNPKFGITWTPSSSTTLRTAWFRTLRRNIISDQTTEPTQIAGFSQFFDDPVVAEAWRYGMAIDQKFSSTVFGGAEISRRNIEFPSLEIISDPLNPLVIYDEYDEDLARAYIYWIPNKWLSTSAEFLYEMFEKDPLAFYNDLETYKFPLGINISLPSGFSARVTATYVYQEGDFGDPRYEPVVSLDDDFLTVDCALSYRLPKRFGKISIEAKNLFGQHFQYQDTDFLNPRMYPEQIILMKFTLSL